MPTEHLRFDRLYRPEVYARLDEALNALQKARKALAAVPGGEEMTAAEADTHMAEAERVWRQYEQAVLDCVRADKRMLWLLPDLRLCVARAQHFEYREFFTRLARAVSVGVRRDKRLGKLEPNFYRAAELLSEGMSLTETAKEVGWQKEDKALLRRLKRRRLV